MLYAEPTVFKNTPMHLCNTKYNSYRLVFVNAEHNVDLYIKLRLLVIEAKTGKV